MKNNDVVRTPIEFINFIDKATLNRIKNFDLDKKQLSRPAMMKIIVKYFRLNNDNYIEMLQIKEDKNVR